MKKSIGLKKGRNVYISIGRYSSTSTCFIELIDEKYKKIARVELSAEDFAKAITGLGHVSGVTV